MFIDVAQSPDRWALPADYGPSSIDLIITINMIHISSNASVAGLFQSASGLLKSGAHLICYGPFGKDGQITPQSNVNFDENLKRDNPEWGLRMIEDLSKQADGFGINLDDIYEMPANNFALVFTKQ